MAFYIDRITERIKQMREFIVRDKEYSYLVIADNDDRQRVFFELDKLAFAGVELTFTTSKYVDGETSDNKNQTINKEHIVLKASNDMEVEDEVVMRQMKWREIYELMLLSQEVRVEHLRDAVMQYYFF